MVAQHLTEGFVEQVGASVVSLNGTTTLYIHASHELCLRLFRQLIDDVDGKSVLLLGVEHLNLFILADEHAGVANLTTHLAIEWCLVENDFIGGALLLLHLSIFNNVGRMLGVVVTDELTLCIAQHYPVA